jgi:hypothetical protein
MAKSMPFNTYPVFKARQGKCTPFTLSIRFHCELNGKYLANRDGFVEGWSSLLNHIMMDWNLVRTWKRVS